MNKLFIVPTQVFAEAIRYKEENGLPDGVTYSQYAHSRVLQEASAGSAVRS